MRLSSAVRALLLVIFVIVLPARAMFAQSSQSVSPASVPRLIKFGGVFHPADGQPAGAVESVTFSIYADPDGGVPLWQETQTIMLDEQGRYTVLLGASSGERHSRRGVCLRRRAVAGNAVRAPR